VLVAVAIVVVLVCLLLTAVAKVRSAAGITSCQNNLKWFGMALHSYHDANEHFPAATDPTSVLPHERRLSWMFEIDPYLEARMDPDWKPQRNEPWDSEANMKLVRKRPRSYLCSAAPGEIPPEGAPVTSYVGATGIGEDAALLPKGHPRTGVFGYDRWIAFADIRDGTPNTVMVLETALDNGPWAAGGRPTARPFVTAGQDPIGRSGQFGGWHRGGATVGFADGSVRFVRDSISPDAFAALFTVAGRDDPGAFED
jgi:prepilin-type processing-associated H-X9-DG protein